VIRTLFFGSPEAAVPALDALVRRSDVTGVVTQPDRPRGRSGSPRPSPVAAAASRHGIVVTAPSKMSEVVALAGSCDLGVLVAFGRLIPPKLLAAPRLGIVNVHFSLLPRWRGAAPVQRAILAGDDRTGVTLMQMDEGLDTGDVLATAETAIGRLEDSGSLTGRLAHLGADLLAAELGAVERGELEAVPQPEAGVTLAPRFDAADARIDATIPQDGVLRLVRAFAPRPGAWGEIEGSRFKVLAAAPAPVVVAPGAIVDHDGAPVLGTSTGAVELTLVQPAGRAAIDGRSWFNGRRRRPAVLS
jgi:methionyl-tRNA formyltransferase